MEIGTLISMFVILFVVIGGFVYFLLKAIRNERAKAKLND